MRLRTPFQAGGNLGGDLDHLGRPVVPGLWYVLEGEPEDGGVCVAGPFATVDEAITAAWDGPIPEAFTGEDMVRADHIARSVIDSLAWVEVEDRGQWEAPFLDGYVVCPAATDPALNHPNEDELILFACQTCGRRWPIEMDFEQCPYC